MPDKLEGRYFAQGSSGSVSATLSRSPDGPMLLELEDGKSKRVTFVEASDRLGSVARKINFHDGSVFECADNDAVDLLFDTGNSFFGRLTRLEGSLKFVIIAAIASVVLLVGLYRYGLPLLATAAANVTPPAVITLIDNGALDTVDRVFFSESKLEAQRKQELSVIFDELVKISGQANPPLNLYFRDGGRIGANAIALPGGAIILTDQLVALAKSDDEVAGVLAHEIGHVEYRHSLKQIYRVLGVAFMLSVVGGDSGQIVEDIVAQAVAVDNLSYTREFESEADRHSVSMMIAADRDPVAFVDLLDRILGTVGENDKTGWLSTHPGNTDRREAVQAEVESITGSR